jgi:hypothetical protein
MRDFHVALKVIGIVLRKIVKLDIFSSQDSGMQEGLGPGRAIGYIPKI